MSAYSPYDDYGGRKLRSTLKGKSSFHFVLLGFMFLAVHSTKAGSAVAMEPQHGNLTTAYGGSAEREEARALETGRRLYGPEVRIIAATDVTGYGAIAVASFGGKVIVGVALGKTSEMEADTRAIEECLKAGGVNPQVKWSWRG